MNFSSRIILSILIILLGINNLSFSFLMRNNHTDLLTITESQEAQDNSHEIYENYNRVSSLKNLKVGDVVEFGRFYDIVDDEILKVPIKWQVLDELNGFSLLITDYIIKTMPYNYSWSPTNWKESNIRTWLNNDFYDIAFNDTEKHQIQKVITEFTDNKALVQLSTSDTDLPIGNYYYDVEIDTADGRVDTVIGPARFKIIGGVKY